MSAFTDYAIKDINLAEFGRKELNIAEIEMPGLMAIRHEFARQAAFERRPHCRFPAHDHPNRGTD